MGSTMTFSKRALAAALLAAGALAVQAQEATIRKNLESRLSVKIDEISKTPMNGLYEIRSDLDVYYTDAEGNFLIKGQLIDTRQQRNLTEERMEKLMAIDFAQLPLKDAFTIVRGNGKRKLAVFEDPNCGYCKRFEQELQKVNNVTVHMFLYPILGPNSTEKTRDIWCSKDRAKAWLDHMLKDVEAPTAKCDVAAINRNLEFGRKFKITGTPTLVFADGTRVPGAIPATQVEKFLSEPK